MVLEPSGFLRLCETISGGIQTIVTWVTTLFQRAKDATAQLNEMVKARANMSVEESNHLLYDNYGGGYASGGFPDTGELFVAREAGPELVGTIGGKTSVANNDQIVSGIRQGVFEAVMQAMSNQSGGEVVLKLDGDVLAKGVTKYQRFNAISANI